jgi:methyl-accepting chemotaxis protein
MNFSFKAKLIGLCLFFTSICIVIGVISYSGLHKVKTDFEKVSNLALPNLNLINSMYLDFRAVRINLRSLGLIGLTKEQEKDFIAKVNESIESYEKDNKAYNNIPFQEGEQALYDKVNSSWKNFKEIGARVVKHHEAATADSKKKLNQIFLHDCPEAANAYTLAVTDLKNFHIDKAKLFTESTNKSVQTTNMMIMWGTLLCVSIGMAFGYFFSAKASSSLTLVARQLLSNADKVAAASSQIASSSQQLSESSSEQAASLEETATSLEEITSMIAKATENAQNTTESSSESHKKAEEGRGSVDQMLSSMDEISQSNEAILTQINESNRQMSDIVKVIQDIGNRTKVINEIVFQTKLLSFNASVEAARAGEHGKGFAVVAEEVGNLAQMSGNAAKEITDMLDASISKVEGIVKDTQKKVEGLVHSGKEKVDSGVNVAKQCSDLLNEIVQNVSRVSGLSLEISQASKEQAQGVSEINKAMSQLDTVTQQNAATSEETASAAEELSGQAESLRSSVEDLMEVITGRRHSVSRAPASRPVPSATKAPKSNIVHIKSAKPKARKTFETTSKSFQKASGDDSSIPDRDDDGFEDV